jgi:hypothetical protein
VGEMNILNAAFAAISLVIVTMTIRDWVQAIREAYEERRKKRDKMKFYK